jgi:hypothetical protein
MNYFESFRINSLLILRENLSIEDNTLISWFGANITFCHDIEIDLKFKKNSQLICVFHDSK